MSQQPIFKVSGKKVTLPQPGSDWVLTQRPGGWVIAERRDSQGKVLERQRLMMSEVRGKLSASLSGRLWQGDVVLPTRGKAGASASDSDLVAQFPGKVRKLLVAEGASVQEGESLVLVEAMKMEFAIKAPYNGKVTKVWVKEGQQLSPGDRFVDMESAK